MAFDWSFTAFQTKPYQDYSTSYDASIEAARKQAVLSGSVVSMAGPKLTETQYGNYKDLIAWWRQLGLVQGETFSFDPKNPNSVILSYQSGDPYSVTSYKPAYWGSTPEGQNFLSFEQSDRTYWGRTGIFLGSLVASAGLGAYLEPAAPTALGTTGVSTGSQVPALATEFGTTTPSLEAARLGIASFSEVTPQATALFGAETSPQLAAQSLGFGVEPLATTYTPLSSTPSFFDTASQYGRQAVDQLASNVKMTSDSVLYGTVAKSVNDMFGKTGRFLTQLLSLDFAGALQTIGAIGTPASGGGSAPITQPTYYVGTGSGGGGSYYDDTQTGGGSSSVQILLIGSLVALIIFFVLRKRG